MGPGGRGCGPLRGRRSSWAPGGWGRTHLPGWRPPGAPCGRQGLGGAHAAASSPGPGAPAAAAATRPRLPAQRIGAAAGGPRRRGGARGAGRAAAPGPCYLTPPPRSPSLAPQHRCGPAPPRARPLPAPAPEDPSHAEATPSCRATPTWPRPPTLARPLRPLRAPSFSSRAYFRPFTPANLWGANYVPALCGVWRGGPNTLGPLSQELQIVINAMERQGEGAGWGAARASKG